jgi:hypothetical protein
LPEQGKELTEKAVIRDACLLVDVLGPDVRCVETLLSCTEHRLAR